MSNTIIIGGSLSGNTLYIGPSGWIVALGSASGSSVVIGEGLTSQLGGEATGSSIGSSTVVGVVNAPVLVIGNAAGTSLAQYLVQFVGNAYGTSTAIATTDAASKFKPLDLFVGYSSDGTSITIPISSVIGLTAEEADVTTGDWREVLQAILLRAVEHHRSFVWSEQLRTYDAFGMNILTNSTYNRHFSITFYNHQCDSNVAQEP